MSSGTRRGTPRASSRARRSTTRDPVEIAGSDGVLRSVAETTPTVQEHVEQRDDDEEDPDPDDSTSRRNTSKTGRREINRRVPHQSFAYGAPSDESGGRTSIGGRMSGGGGSGGAGDVADDAEAEVQAEAEADGLAPVLPRPVAPRQQPAQSAAMQPPAARYAALKARKAAAAAAAAAAAPSAATMSATSSHASTHETSDDEELDMHGNSRRKSSAPPTSSAPNSTSMSSRSHRGTSATTSTTQLNSFFTRGPPPTTGSSTSAQQQPRLAMPTSLLRGAQKQAQTHIPPLLLSPRRRGGGGVGGGFNDVDSMRSSDAGDSVSRSFASEEAMVQRDMRARDQTPPANASSQGWFEKISPWRNRVSNGSNAMNGDGNGTGPAAGDVPANDDASDEDLADASTRTRTARRRPRTSATERDQTYRPPKGFEIDDEDDDDGSQSSSDGGRRPRRKTGRKSAGNDVATARGGRDDNRIWMAGKKRKGRRSSGGRAAQVEGEDLNGTVVNDDDDDDDDDDEAGKAAVDGMLPSADTRRKRPRTARRQEHSSRPSSLSWKTIGGAGLAAFAAYSYLSNGGPATSNGGGLFSSLSPWRTSTYSPPSTPPSDLSALATRLLSLESTVGSLSSTSSSLLQSRDGMAKQIAALQTSSQDVAKLLQSLQARDAAERGRLDARVRALEDEGKRLREMQADGAQSAHEIQELRAKLARNEEEIARVLTAALRAEHLANEAKAALKPLLEMNLPAQLPVKIDKKTGKPVIEGWFYEQLRGILAGGDHKGGKSTTSPSSSSSSPIDWEQFRSVNEASLRSLVAEESTRVFSAHRAQHAILSRSDFLELLSRELDGMKSVLEARFNENAQGIQNDILAKVRSQQSMYEESGSAKKSRGGSGAARGPHLPPSSVAAPDSDISLSHIQTKDGSDATTAIRTLIDAALEAYSADKINRADYAAYTAGGRVIPSMTSPTYEYATRHSGAGSRGWRSWFTSSSSPPSSRPLIEQYRGRSPAHALHHDNSPGMCWPFAGSYGQLGIQLARPVVVSDITIDHASTSLLLGEGDVGTAPREITVSGYIERAEDRQRLREWQADQQRRQRQHHSDDDDNDGEDSSFAEVHHNPPPNHIHLASFTYQAGRGARATQTFTVSDEARALRIPVVVLQVRVHSNHGNDRLTCLYRVRVHGDEVRDGE